MVKNPTHFQSKFCRVPSPLCNSYITCKNQTEIPSFLFYSFFFPKKNEYFCSCLIIFIKM